MKSILIIGMGRFGHHLAANFLENGHDVMIVDEDEEKLEDMVPYATSTRIGDCTSEEVLKSIGVRNFDVVFVCIGTNFQSSLEITSLVKELGATRVVSKATRDIQAKFLLRNGAERYSLDNIFDYIDLPGAFGIYEMPPLREWVGRSIRESDIAAKYKISILGIKKKHEEEMSVMPSADYIIRDTDHLMVMAGNEVAERLLEQNRHNFAKAALERKR